MRPARLLKALALLTAVALGAGCFGKFAATHGLYKFNREVSNDPLVRTLMLWALVIIPVYEVFSLADFFIFNPIEFWTGSNVLTDGSLDTGHAARTAAAEVHADAAGVEVTKGGVAYRIASSSEGGYSIVRNGELVGAGVLAGDTLSLFDMRGERLASFTRDEAELVRAALAGRAGVPAQSMPN